MFSFYLCQTKKESNRKGGNMAVPRVSTIVARENETVRATAENERKIEAVEK